LSQKYPPPPQKPNKKNPTKLNPTHERETGEREREGVSAQERASEREGGGERAREMVGSASSMVVSARMAALPKLRSLGMALCPAAAASLPAVSLHTFRRCVYCFFLCVLE
jgi:hypothetical protein